MKHPYSPSGSCTCERCTRERTRRQTQSAADQHPFNPGCACPACQTRAAELRRQRRTRTARQDRAIDRWIENLDHDYSMNG